jgi:hypothetical protein
MNPLRHPRLTGAATFAVGLALALFAAVWQARANAAVASNRFDALVLRASEQVVARLQIYEYGLRGARGAVLAAGLDQLDAARYRLYSESRDLDREFPGARGIGVIRRVARADEPAFVALMRLTGQPSFAIRQFAPHDGERYVVQYVEPRERNEAGIGVDVASEESRRAAADLAARSGSATLTGPITLARGVGGKLRSFLLFLPIYRIGKTPSTPEAREAATLGWTLAPLVIDEVLEGFDLRDGEFSLALHDVSGPDVQTFFSSPGSSDAPAAGLARRVSIPIYGRTWEAEIRARPRFIEVLNERSPRAVAAAALAFVVLLSVLIFLYAENDLRARHSQATQTRATLEANASLERQVVERTALLESARRDLQGILDAIPSVIGYWDRSLRNRFSNHAYLSWLGVDPAQMPGMHAEDVLDEVRYKLARPHMEAALRGEAQAFELTVPMPGGHGERHALAHYVPDVVNGEVRGFYTIAHDITQQTQDRARLAAALRENEALLRTIHQHSIVSVTDREGRILDVNESFCRVSGYSREELLGQTHRTINSGVHGREVWEDLWRTIAAAQPWRGEICNRAKDGSLYWVDSIIAPFVGEDGQIEKYISIRTDITAAKLTEQRLRESQSFLDRAGKVAGIGAWELDVDTEQMTWSAQMYVIHEVEPGYPMRRFDDGDFYPPQSRPNLLRALQAAIQDGTGWDLDLELITGTGRSSWVRIVGEAERRDGRIVRLVGSMQDITSRKRAEDLLQQAHDRFSVATEAAGMGVWELDAGTGVLTCDDRLCRLYGRERSAAVPLSKQFARSLHADDRARVSKALASALAGEHDYDPEFRIVWPDGEVRHLKANARVIRDARGAPVRMTGVNIDITERKRAEMVLRETTAMLRSVLDAASEVSLIATEPDLTIRLFNSGAERLLGYSAAEVVGRMTPISIHDAGELEARSRELTAELGRPVHGGAVFTEASTLRRPHEWTYIGKNGSRVTVSLVITAMLSDEGELLGYLGVAHDVTRQKQHERSLRHAIHKAEQASVAKSQFLANMSHEIRTPMNAVIGLSYLLGESELAPEQAAFLAKIQSASKSLLAVINDVLDLSKIEAGELIVEKASFSLSELVRQLADVMTVQAGAKRLTFDIDMSPHVPDVIEGDVTRLNQILTNLLSNAFKFTDRGGITLRVRPIVVGADRVRLRFAVHDTGIGIAANAQSRIFTPFTQADASTTRRFGGTGLGLSIVKRLANLLGGEVGLDSTPGVGSTFWVELGFATRALEIPELRAPTSIGPGNAALTDVHVLIVDDSEINLEVARRILQRQGAKVTLAGNGKEAIEQLVAHPRDFDVVLMDVQMPVLDGHEATQYVRTELGLTELPILALTAGALTSERQRALAVGMDDFISKPFDARSLVRSILRHVKATGRLVAQLPPAVTSDTRPTPPWPDIDGIDSSAVQARLGGDLDLFQGMLGRFLEEFEEVSVPLGAVDAAALAVQASRMHKLKGSAGSLGATALHALAGDAETACRVGDIELAADRSQRVAAQLRLLRLASDSVLGLVSSPPDSGVTCADAKLDPEALRELVHLLHERSLSARSRFNVLSPSLRRHLGDASFAVARGHVEHLRFGEAALLIESCA